MRNSREIYIPKTNEHQIVECQKINDDLVFYLWSWGGKLFAMAFIGKRSIKPTWQFMFRSVEDRQKRIDQAISAFNERQKGKEEYKQKRKINSLEFAKTLQVGQIFYASWGWEQTNIDFYKVVSIKGTRAIVVSVGQKLVEQTGHMSEKVTSDPMNVISKELSTTICDGYLKLSGKSSGNHLYFDKYDSHHQTHYA